MSAGECPRRSLTPQDTCIQQSAALCLHGAQTPVFGVRAPGVRGDKPAEPSTLTLPLQTSPCSSMRKGVPLSAWENMGRPPGHGFSPSLGWLFSGLDLAAHAHSGSPTTSLPRVTYPTLELSDHLHRVPRHLSGKRKPTLPPRGPRDSPWATLPSSSPSSSQTVCAGKTWGPGAWVGDFPRGSLRARGPLSPGECPRRPLTLPPHLIPAISGPPTPWGRNTWAGCVSNWLTRRQTCRPLRPEPTTGKIPLFFNP